MSPERRDWMGFSFFAKILEVLLDLHSSGTNLHLYINIPLGFLDFIIVLSLAFFLFSEDINIGMYLGIAAAVFSV